MKLKEEKYGSLQDWLNEGQRSKGEIAKCHRWHIGRPEEMSAGYPRKSVKAAGRIDQAPSRGKNKIRQHTG
jgi:hypothetical protein